MATLRRGRLAATTLSVALVALFAANAGRMPAVFVSALLPLGGESTNLVIEEPFLALLKLLSEGHPPKPHIKHLLDERESAEAALQLSTTDLLARAGFKFEVHNATATDGYVTQLVRVVNPEISRESLRAVPVVMYAGQGTSPAAFILASLEAVRARNLRGPSSSHDGAQEDAHAGHDDHASHGAYDGHEGRGGLESLESHEGGSGDHPRSKRGAAEHAHEDNGLHEPVERSLGLALSNRGYDVWLVPARGVDAQNQQRVERTDKDSGPFDVPFALLKGLVPSASLDPVDTLRQLAAEWRSLDFWSFSNDQLIENEFERQLECVRSASGASRVSLVTFSNGAFVALGFMSIKPDYARQHIDAAINLAPAVYVNKFNPLLGLSGFLNTFSPPGWPFPESNVDALKRGSEIFFCRSKSLRYSVCKLLLNELYGQSELFNSHLELFVFNYFGRPMSPNGLRQILQVASSGALRHFDNGPLGNLIAYGHLEARNYQLAHINHPHVHIMSGERDAIADTDSIHRLIGELSIGHSPGWIDVPGYNHLDLLIAHDNGPRVNRHVLQLLNERSEDNEYYLEGDEEGREADHNSNKKHGSGSGPEKEHEHYSNSPNKASEVIMQVTQPPGSYKKQVELSVASEAAKPGSNQAKSTY